MHIPQTFLELKDLRFKMLIGCNEEEKILQQEIQIYVKINYPKPPIGCQTDLLSDTICYAEIVSIIHKICSLKHYNLIEHLGYEIYSQIKKHYNYQTTIKINKINPPIKELFGGASFAIEDSK